MIYEESFENRTKNIKDFEINVKNIKIAKDLPKSREREGKKKKYDKGSNTRKCNKNKLS